MSAANMNLNVQTLNQIGGALQQLNADGTIDQSGTQQMLAQLQQQLGTSFTQTTVSDNLHTDFVAQGGFGASQIVGLAFAVVVAIMTAGAASAAIGAVAAEGSTFAAATAATTTAEGVAMPAMTAGLGNIALSAAAAGFTSSIASQLTMTGQLSWANAFEAAGIAGITAGLTNGITYNSNSGLDFTTQPLAVGSATNSIAGLAGVNPVAGTNVSQATTTTASLAERGLAMLAEAGISAGVGTAVEGGSFATAFEHALTGELAASGAFTIGDETDPLSLQNIFAHAALGCAASAADGTGCAGGAIGAATSAAISPLAILALDPTGSSLDTAQQAAVTALAVMTGGIAAGLAGADAQAGATWAQNEATNNSELHTAEIVASCLQNSFCSAMLPLPIKAAAIGYVASASTSSGSDGSRDNSPQLPDAPNKDDDDLTGGSQGQKSGGFVLTGATPVSTCIPVVPAGCVPIAIPVPTAFTLPNPTAILSSGGGDGGSTGQSTNQTSSNDGGSTSASNLGSDVKLYPDGSLRTPDGKFASAAGSPPPGTASASQFASYLSNNGINVVGQEVVVNGPLGTRRYDIVTQDANGVLHGIEVKSGSATPDSYQQFTDMFVNRFGAQATGRFAGKTISSATTVYLPY